MSGKSVIAAAIRYGLKHGTVWCASSQMAASNRNPPAENRTAMLRSLTTAFKPK